jgi:hypothetical protein
MERTFKCYITEDPVAVSLKEKLNDAEAKLAADRNKMELGYTDPKTGTLSACQQISKYQQISLDSVPAGILLRYLHNGHSSECKAQSYPTNYRVEQLCCSQMLLASTVSPGLQDGNQQQI